jgi:hypothetical protein
MSSSSSPSVLGKRSRANEPETKPPTQKPLDWSHLRHYGYQVFPGVLTAEECKAAKDGVWKWMVSLDRGLQRNNPSTWKNPAWPSQVHGIVQWPCASHIPEVWDVRQNEKVVNIWSNILATPATDLISSFDRINIVHPNMRLSQKPWFHIDQGARLRGPQCVQGFVNLEDTTEEDASLMVVPKSHLLHDEFFLAFPDRTKTSDNWVKFTDAELEWWQKEAMGEEFQPKRVTAKAGDVVVWDSRLIHCGASSVKGRKSWRYVIYTCYEPRRLATEEQLAKKRKVFELRQGTSHWPRLSKVFPKPQWCHKQKEAPETVRCVKDEDLTPLGKRLAGF